MSIKIEFKSKDDPSNSTNLFDSIVREVKVDNEEFKKKLADVGVQTAIVMLAIIAQNKVRPQNGEPTSLEECIKCEFFEDGWGVGDISLLNTNAEYWAAINWGSSHMVGKRLPTGGFNPGEAAPNAASFRQGRYGKGQGNFSAIVKNPIPPMNYIEKTIFWLNDTLNKLQLKGT